MPQISAFDLDNTLIRGNSSFHFCHFLCYSKAMPFSSLFFAYLYYLRHSLLGLSLAELHQKVFKQLLAGRSLDTLEEQIPRFLETYLIPALYMPAVSCLKRAQHLGHYTMILSNSPSFLVKAIADYLGVNEWRATEYALDEERKLSHVETVLSGQGKAGLLLSTADRLGVEEEGITAYSDSYFDLPFLEAAGNAVAVNPDKKLRAFSFSRDWSVI